MARLRLTRRSTRSGSNPSRGRIHPLDDGDPGPGNPGDVAELEGDEATAQEGDATGQLRQLEDVVAGGQVLVAGQRQGHRPRPGGDDHMARADLLPVDDQRGGADEARVAVEGGDPVLLERRALGAADAVGERAFEVHQCRPRDASRPRIDALASESADRVHGAGDPYQHLLGVAAAQLARAAERPLIDDRDPPAGGAAPARHGLPGGAGPENHEVKTAALHEGPPTPPRPPHTPAGRAAV